MLIMKSRGESLKGPYILLAAGGTGGHIYPALSVADALRSKIPNLQIHFVGTPTGLENKLIPREGYCLHHIPIGRLNRNVSIQERLLTLLRLPWALIQSWRLIRRLKPEIVVGFGGHASGPVLLMAALTRRPSAIWEPNAHPGLANRILSRFVDRCLVVFEQSTTALRGKSIEKVGIPVRQKIAALAEKSPPHQVHQPLRVLVFGGSQGARGINQVVVETALQQAKAWTGRVEIVHQVGPTDFSTVQSRYQSTSYPPPVQAFEYLHDMEERYRWADLVVCRAGTGTLSELAATARASLLIPLPSAADNHQQKNAEAFADQGASLMILQKDFNCQSFSHFVEDFIAHPEKLILMSQAARSFYQAQAAEHIAEALIGGLRLN